MSKYTVDCFTEKSVSSKYPEVSYFPDSTEEVAVIIHNCTRHLAGIKKVEVWINNTDDRKTLR